MRIINGRLVYNNEIRATDILIENGFIQKIGRLAQSEKEQENEIIDAQGMLILPGLIDVHVHLREPGDMYKEDFITGSKAAIAGGFTTILDMPNNKIPTITAQRLREKEILAKQKALCDVFFHFGATDDNFAEVKKAKSRSLKAYLSETTGKITVSEGAFAMHCTTFDTNKPIVMHAENQKLLERIAKIVPAKRKLHLAHATTNGEIDAAQTMDATVEVAPHHLFLSKKHAEKLGKHAGVKPSLRDETDRKKLWTMLDQIDCIATDHAPHTLEDKEDGAYGFPGLETSLGLMLDAYTKKNITLEWLVSRMAKNPARLFGFDDRGEIAVGKKADLVFVDLKKEWVVKGEEQETKCKWSPFDGWKLKGKVKQVIRNGIVTYENGEFVKS